SRPKLADPRDRWGQWLLRRKSKARQTLVGQEPEVTVAVTQRRPYVALRQAIIRGIVEYRASAGLDPVHTPPGSGVYAAQPVFGDAPHFIARKMAWRVVNANNRMRSRDVNFGQARVRCHDPDVAVAIAVQRIHRTWRNAGHLFECSVLQPE